MKACTIRVLLYIFYRHFAIQSSLYYTDAIRTSIFITVALKTTKNHLEQQRQQQYLQLSSSLPNENKSATPTNLSENDEINSSSTCESVVEITSEEENSLKNTNMSSDQMYQPVVICGPSGVGKGTIINMLMSEYNNNMDDDNDNDTNKVFGFSVSHTTRQPREGEVDGVHSNFTTVDHMKQEINENPISRAKSMTLINRRYNMADKKSKINQYIFEWLL